MLISAVLLTYILFGIILFFIFARTIQYLNQSFN